MWFKIDEAGLQSPGSPGTWASDVLVGTEKQYTVTLPTDLTDGDYVLRHEIIALHGAGEMGGAQVSKTLDNTISFWLLTLFRTTRTASTSILAVGETLLNETLRLPLRALRPPSSTVPTIPVLPTPPNERRSYANLLK